MRYEGLAWPAKKQAREWVSKIGGHPFGLPKKRWPKCRCCAREMDFLLQLNLRDPMKLSRRWAFAYVFMCHGYLDEQGGRQCETFLANQGANHVVLVETSELSQKSTKGGVERWPEFVLQFRDYRDPEHFDDDASVSVAYKQALEWMLEGRPPTHPGVSVNRLPDGSCEFSITDPSGEPLDQASQTVMLGRKPIWLQSDETPVCPVCGARTKLLCQVSSEVRRCGGARYPDGFHLPFGGGGMAYAFVCSKECSPAGVSLLWQCT